MNSMFNSSKLLAAGLCGIALAGCNAVESVQEAPTTALPPSVVVLAGNVIGLGSTRSIVIVNNGNNDSALGVVAPDPVTPIATTTGPAVVSMPFSFGTLPEGSPYNVTVRTNPYGRSCTVANGTGVLNRLSPPMVTITCVPNVPRFNLTVALNTAFSSSTGAKVRVKTEEALYEGTPTPGATSITFTNVLFNGAGAGAPNPSPAFAYTVSAQNTVGGTTNRCPMTSPTGSNPTANVTTPAAGACSFTIAGSLNYSRPQGVTSDPALPGPVTLELRDVQGNTKATQVVSAYGNFTFNDAGTSTAKLFQSNASAVYDVVVTSEPATMKCIVGDSALASLFVLISGNPTSVTATGVTSANGTPTATTLPVLGTRLSVFCRNRPTTANTLAGVFRLTRQTATIASIVSTKTRTGASTSTITQTNAPATTAVINSLWRPFDTTAQNTASNAILTFFDDGTFLYGQHNANAQVEHGFYDYNSTAKTLRYTIHTDATTSTTYTPTSAFPGGFLVTATNSPGISAGPGPFTFTTAPTLPAAQRHIAMCNVLVGSGNPRVITGTFGGPTLCGTAIPVAANGAPADPAAPGSGVASTTTTATGQVALQLDWELTEPRNVTGQMTGRWTTQDHREFWVYDSLTYYGIHAGVNGGAANLQSACFTMENETASDSFFTRRGSNTGCYAWNNPSATQTYNFSGAEAVDSSPAATSVPGFVGRIPGGGTAFDGRSPSPVYFHIAPAATWYSSLPANFQEYFPTAPAPALTTWCTGTSDVLGLRHTLNNEPVISPVVPILNSPKYLCRQ